MSSPLSSHNEVQLSRNALISLLDDLSLLVLQEFGCQIRLFIHGGAVMILHPYLSASSTRRTTRDVDYIRRAFGHEWRKRGVHDAEERLQHCINAVAAKFHIGTDWMNADPDVALPFAKNPRGELYDPIYHDSKQPNNIEMNTVYTSPGLIVISVTMFWGVALKLVRYKKEDPTDIVAMLRHGTKLNGVQWTPHIMENWIKTLCWPMGYNSYKPHQAEELRSRIHDAVRQLRTSPENSPLEEHSHTALIPSTNQSPQMLTSLHTMSRSLAPHAGFSQPQLAIPTHLMHISSHHSLSPYAPMGERIRRSSMVSLRHPAVSPPKPKFISSHSSHSISHSHSQSPSTFRMPEPWAPPPSLLHFHQSPGVF
ncbi:hypothetical protein K503DRAFT_725519 [Rhizopogon vinicolor AM-OR11-026]|uniref:Uncharacterized protein n=1 Tax=Rhizopogon vinicolor AM-OR11-026 TaxID=1314800 RepID=A0A1B7MM91_9AGAM|nr:hypothetical protein K503DRAFT_725519 [Rhizopogon vinicolor AM-OR11-026]